MKIHFFHPDLVGLVNELSFKPENGLDHWITTTYIRLKKYYDYITIGNEIPKSGIIIFHKRYFPNNLKPSNLQFFICLQVDSGRHPFAQYHVVHNPYQANFYHFPKTSIDFLFGFSFTKFIYGWSQYKIIKRDKSRSKLFNTISFHGNINNIPEEILSDDFQLFLKFNNLEFKIKSDPTSWGDFHDTDLTLCIRNFDKNKYYSKPFLKISNSLIAQVPVVSGFESSSIFFKNKFVDIPVVKNIFELKMLILDILKKKYDPFEQIVDFQVYHNTFQNETIEEKWIWLLDRAKRDYEKWLKISKLKREVFFIYRSL